MCESAGGGNKGEGYWVRDDEGAVKPALLPARKTRHTHTHPARARAKEREDTARRADVEPSRGAVRRGKRKTCALVSLRGSVQRERSARAHTPRESESERERERERVVTARRCRAESSAHRAATQKRVRAPSWTEPFSMNFHLNGLSLCLGWPMDTRSRALATQNKQNAGHRPNR